MNEQELRQAMSALEVYRVQLESIAENMQLIQMSQGELARARETLAQYKGAEPGSDILVPIGGNSFVLPRPPTTARPSSASAPASPSRRTWTRP